MPSASDGSSAAGRAAGARKSARPHGAQALVLLSAQWTRYLLQVVGLVVLARVLSPGDYGVAAMALAVAGLANIIGDFGFSLSAVRTPVLAAQTATNLFWLNGGVGLLSAALLAAAAQPLALFYQQPRVTVVLLVMSAAFLANGLAVQFKVQLNRNAEFARLAVAETAGPLIGLLTAVVAAVLHAGAVALALQVVVASWVTLALAAAWARWRPGLPRREPETASHLRFGRSSFALQLVNYLSGNIDTVLVGRVLGAVALGLYNRAFQLVALPIQQVASPLTRIFLPRLSVAVADGTFSDKVLRAQRMLSFPLLAVLSLLAATAAPLLTLVLGAEWTSAAGLLRTLAVGGGFQVLGYVYYWAYLAHGRPGRLFLAELPGRVIGIAIMAIGVHWGAEWVAAGGAVVQILVFAVVVLDGRALGVPASTMLRTSGVLLLLFGAAFVASALADGFVTTSSPLLRLLVGATAWAVVVGIGIAVLAPVRREVGGMLQTVRRRGSLRTRPDGSAGPLS
jgi:PST family polysaccharide transporter